MISETTICAIATSGQGAIAIIRVSGPQTFAVVQSIFRPATAGKTLADLPPNTIHFGTIAEGEEIVDEVLVSLFRAPHSYTGEDVIDFIKWRQKIAEAAPATSETFAEVLASPKE